MSTTHKANLGLLDNYLTGTVANQKSVSINTLDPITETSIVYGHPSVFTKFKVSNAKCNFDAPYGYDIFKQAINNINAIKQSTAVAAAPFAVTGTQTRTRTTGGGLMDNYQVNFAPGQFIPKVNREMDPDEKSPKGHNILSTLQDHLNAENALRYHSNLLPLDELERGYFINKDNGHIYMDGIMSSAYVIYGIPAMLQVLYNRYNSEYPGAMRFNSMLRLGYVACHAMRLIGNIFVKEFYGEQENTRENIEKLNNSPFIKYLNAYYNDTSKYVLETTGLDSDKAETATEFITLMFNMMKHPFTFDLFLLMYSCAWLTSVYLYNAPIETLDKIIANVSKSLGVSSDPIECIEYIYAVIRYELQYIRDNLYSFIKHFRDNVLNFTNHGGIVRESYGELIGAPLRLSIDHDIIETASDGIVNHYRKVYERLNVRECSKHAKGSQAYEKLKCRMLGGGSHGGSHPKLNIMNPNAAITIRPAGSEFLRSGHLSLKHVSINDDEETEVQKYVSTVIPPNMKTDMAEHHTKKKLTDDEIDARAFSKMAYRLGVPKPEKVMKSKVFKR
jgi:hypothetical protein